MLGDVLFLTKKVCSKALLKEVSLYKQGEVYDVYRNLQAVINDIDSVIYYLHNSFWDNNNWQKSFNKDLEKLNKSAKTYLHNLLMLNPIYIQEVYGVIAYYTFVKYEYVVGFIETKTNLLQMNKLKIRKKREYTDINTYKKIDLFTLEARINLKNRLYKINEELIEELKKLELCVKKSNFK
jgi:hypothetical protein